MIAYLNKKGRYHFFDATSVNQVFDPSE